jgi:23S rRNA (pseudouridine1915-N3)-methyltransferase
MAARLRILAVGTRMPGWVEQGFEEYRRRLPRECALELREVPLARRGADTARALADEGEALLAALGADERAIALEVGGRALDTAELATRLGEWRDHGERVAFLIGGPDGLAEACRARARERWSLSRLTLPHPLVRIVLAEQLYRAWSLLAGHPYHR